MKASSFLEKDNIPTKPCNVCGGDVKIDRQHVRRECLIFALEEVARLKAEILELREAAQIIK